MKFEKTVMYLGAHALKLSDGTGYHQVQLYDKDSGPVNINVMDNNRDVLNALQGLDFGSPVVVTFALRPKDRSAYRLVIDHVG